jgi:hypothetical protein
MSIPVLVQVYDEMRRLAIAGSAVAPGDFRLKKLIAPLEKSAEKAPVFAKVAQAVQAVVDSNDKTASTALLELTTLVNAILYTQGATGIAGELKPLETRDLGQTTQTGARTLKPLLEALSSTGSGRIEPVRDAFDRGTFKDLRLIKPALARLTIHPESRLHLRKSPATLWQGHPSGIAGQAGYQRPGRTSPSIEAHASTRSGGVARSHSAGPE